MTAASLRHALKATLLSLTIVALCAPSALSRPLDEVVEAGVLRVVSYANNAPFSFEENGAPAGINVELARKIARELGVEAEIILRMQGEAADDDIRANVWRGPLTGGGVGDIMMSVPIDREFAIRNPEAVFGNAYFQEQVALAAPTEKAAEITSFDVFKTEKVAVQLGTVADYFLMTYQRGALIANVSHHLKPEQGVRQLIDRDVSALMGIRSRLEHLLLSQSNEMTFVNLPIPGIVRKDWVVGMAWREDSRDLGYAVEAALDKLRESGELAASFEKFGVTYVPPPVPD